MDTKVFHPKTGPYHHCPTRAEVVPWLLRTIPDTAKWRLPVVD